MSFISDSWRWLLCQSLCSRLHLKILSFIFLQTYKYIYFCFVFCCYSCFYGSEYGSSPSASLALGSLQESVRTKAELRMFTYDSYLQIWNMYKLNSFLQVTTEVNRILCHIIPSHITPPRSISSRSSGRWCVCECACVCLSYSKQDLMFTCAISEEFSSIAGIGRIHTPEANTNPHSVSTLTLHPSHAHTRSFSFFSPVDSETTSV